MFITRTLVVSGTFRHIMMKCWDILKQPMGELGYLNIQSGLRKYISLYFITVYLFKTNV